MLADNFLMLECFCRADELKYYDSCRDITLAGDGYKVRKMLHFIKNSATPLADYIQLRLCEDSFLQIFASTRDTALLAECSAYIAEHYHDIAEIELCTPHAELLADECLTNAFDIDKLPVSANPVYYIHSPFELADIPMSGDSAVSLAAPDDQREIEREASLGNLNPAEIGPDIFKINSFFKDTQFYILRAGGKIAGFLRAECAYKNIYDIGWLFVLPSYRGRGLAAQLVTYFSRDCFAKHRIPHYGYAVSPSSARVAEKCGFTCDRTPLFFYQLTLR